MNAQGEGWWQVETCRPDRPADPWQGGAFYATRDSAAAHAAWAEYQRGIPARVVAAPDGLRRGA